MAAAAAAALRRSRRVGTAGCEAALCSLQCLPCMMDQSSGSPCVVAARTPGALVSPWAVHAPEQQLQLRRWRHNLQEPRHCHAMLPPSLRPYSTEARPGGSGRDPHSPGQQKRQAARHPAAAAAQAAAAFEAAGWSRREVLNVPNVLSMLRLLSGPVIASWILSGQARGHARGGAGGVTSPRRLCVLPGGSATSSSMLRSPAPGLTHPLPPTPPLPPIPLRPLFRAPQWSLAVPALAVSGATDWADGYAARRLNQPSVIGSYLDPLADKVLICSVVAALGWSVSVPGRLLLGWGWGWGGPGELCGPCRAVAACCSPACGQGWPPLKHAPRAPARAPSLVIAGHAACPGGGDCGGA